MMIHLHGYLLFHLSPFPISLNHSWRKGQRFCRNDRNLCLLPLGQNLVSLRKYNTFKLHYLVSGEEGIHTVCIISKYI